MSQSTQKKPHLPRPASEIPLTAAERSGAETASRVLTEIFPDHVVRTQMERFLAVLIAAAHEANHESWAITLFGDALRLMVGWQTVLYLRRNRLCVAISEAGQDIRITDANRTRLRKLGTLGWITDAIEAIELEAGDWVEVNEIIRPAALGVVRVAAGLNRFSRFIGTHSPGVIDYLRASLSDHVPHSGHRKLDPPSSLPKPSKFWKISAAQRATAWKEFRDRGIIAMYWSGSPDWRSFDISSQVELKQRLADEPFAEGANVASAAREIWQFYREMTPGDYVCIYGNKHVYGW